jgi:hypothetical protein
VRQPEAAEVVLPAAEVLDVLVELVVPAELADSVELVVPEPVVPAELEVLVVRYLAVALVRVVLAEPARVQIENRPFRAEISSGTPHPPPIAWATPSPVGRGTLSALVHYSARAASTSS